MPNWKEVLEEIIKEAQEHPQIPLGAPTAIDVVRRRYYAKILESNGGRNVIAYYSGWLQKPDFRGVDGNRIQIKCLSKTRTYKEIVHFIENSPYGLNFNFYRINHNEVISIQ